MSTGADQMQALLRYSIKKQPISFDMNVSNACPFTSKLMISEFFRDGP